jgi:predicted kinase
MTRPKIIFLIGPPCSGKSTYAKKLAQLPDHFRVNRDDLRIMLKRKGPIGRLGEKIGVLMMEKGIESIINSGLNLGVVIDNTHCKLSYLNEVKQKYGSKADIQIVLFDQPLWKLHFRNVWRCIKTRVWIPSHVINIMYDNFRIVKRQLRGSVESKNGNILHVGYTLQA